jgi:ribonuclease HI
VVCQEDDEGNVIHLWEVGGDENPSTNNRMELKAALEGMLRLSELKGVRGADVRMLTDSKYVIGAMTQWIRNWKRNGWKTSTYEPVKNQDLLEELDIVQGWFGTPPTWVWVKGHAGNLGNENADRIASGFAIGGSPLLFEGPVSRYPYLKLENLPGRKPEGPPALPVPFVDPEMPLLGGKRLKQSPKVPTKDEVADYVKRTSKSPRKAFFWLLSEKMNGRSVEG